MYGFIARDFASASIDRSLFEIGLSSPFGGEGREVHGMQRKGRCKWVYAVYFWLWLIGWLGFAFLIGGINRFLFLLKENALELALFVLSAFIPFAFCLSWFGENETSA